MGRQVTEIIASEGNSYVTLYREVDLASQGATIGVARDNVKEALALFFEAASTMESKRLLHNEGALATLEAE